METVDLHDGKRALAQRRPVYRPAAHVHREVEAGDVARHERDLLGVVKQPMSLGVKYWR